MEISLSLSIGLNGEIEEVMPLASALIEMDLLFSEWDALSSSEQQEKLDQLWREWAYQYVDGGAVVTS